LGLNSSIAPVISLGAGSSGAGETWFGPAQSLSEVGGEAGVACPELVEG